MCKGLVVNKNDRSITSSLKVGETFNKEHKNIIRDIETKILNVADSEFTELNFELSEYKDGSGKKNKMYLMTKDGFTLLAMGFTGERAMEFKTLYIKQFNDMERFITSKLLSKTEFPQLTDNIKLMHETPKSYHYSNELDMINRIVLGKSAKQYREEHNIPKENSIRPYLTTNEIYYIEKLQRADVGMVIAIPDFYDRKNALQKYFNMIVREVKLLK